MKQLSYVFLFLIALSLFAQVIPPITTGGGGGVSSFSFVTANGWSGTVGTPTTTPALTLKSTFTGISKCTNGAGCTAATAGTDYLTTNQTITVTGDVSGSGTNTLALTLPSIITGGTCGDSTHSCQVTANVKGQVTALVPVVISAGGGGATSTDQLTDFLPTVSGSVLTVAPNCSSSHPCIIEQGTAPISVINSGVATFSGTPSGTVAVWVSGAGVLNVQYPSSGFTAPSCTNCTASAVASVPTWPTNSYKAIATCVVSSGVFSACTQIRAVMSIPKTWTPAGTGAPTCAETATDITCTFAAASGGTADYKATSSFSLVNGTISSSVNMTGCANQVCVCSIAITPAIGSQAFRLFFAHTDRLSSLVTTDISPYAGNGGNNTESLTKILDSGSTPPSFQVLAGGSNTNPATVNYTGACYIVR